MSLTFCYKRGGDLHGAVDLNFHQHHRKSAGDCPEFYDPKYFISKEEVDGVGRRIESARGKAPRPYSQKLPDVTVDEDEKSFEAADETREKTREGRYDDTGLGALVCRHDNPIFFVNVDTPGEQQKYAVALIEHFSSLIPEAATVGMFYDIGCVLDCSLSMVCPIVARMQP